MNFPLRVSASLICMLWSWVKKQKQINIKNKYAKKLNSKLRKRKLLNLTVLPHADIVLMQYISVYITPLYWHYICFPTPVPAYWSCLNIPCVRSAVCVCVCVTHYWSIDKCCAKNCTVNLDMWSMEARKSVRYRYTALIIISTKQAGTYCVSRLRE